MSKVACGATAREGECKNHGVDVPEGMGVRAILSHPGLIANGQVGGMAFETSGHDITITPF